MIVQLVTIGKRRARRIAQDLDDFSDLASVKAAMQRYRAATPRGGSVWWDMHCRSLAVFGPEVCLKSSLGPDFVGRYALAEHGGSGRRVVRW